MWILFVPILLPLLIIAGFLSLIMGGWIVGTFFILSAVALNEWTQTFAYKGLFRSKISHEGGHVFKVLNYNINNWHYFENEGEGKIEEFMAFLRQENADVVCFEEHTFIEKYGIEKRMQELYTFCSDKHDVYSKYSISHHHQICLNDDDERVEEIDEFVQLVGSKWKEMPIWAMDVDVRGKTVHLIDCYLMTNNFNRVRYDLFDQPKWKQVLLFPHLVFSYLRFGYKARALGARVLRSSIDGITSPLIVMGDFNDLSGSFCLKTILGQNLYDAWWNGGFGYGFTFCAQKMRLRLDHILYSKDIYLKDISLYKVGFSDHYPIVAEFVIDD